MSDIAEMADELRAKVLAQPDVILDDHDLMQALVAANDRALGGNVVDLRGVAMARLEARLDRLEETHRSVIAAAYENLAGTNQVHRAVLALLEPEDFPQFLRALDREISDALRVDAARLVLEASQEADAALLRSLGPVLRLVSPGEVDLYITRGRNVPVRAVVLRSLEAPAGDLYGGAAPALRSEACMKLDLGPGRLPGLLCLAAEDPQRFTPQHGTDLLKFFSGSFERAVRRWLS